MIWSSSIQIDWTLHKQRKSSERAAKEQRKSSERAGVSFAVDWKQSAQCDSGWVSQGRILPESSNQEYHGGPYACCVTLRVTSFAGSFRVFASTEWILAVYWVCLPTCGDTDLQRLQALADTDTRTQPTQQPQYTAHDGRCWESAVIWVQLCWSKYQCSAHLSTLLPDSLWMGIPLTSPLMTANVLHFCLQVYIMNCYGSPEV